MVMVASSNCNAAGAADVRISIAFVLHLSLSKQDYYDINKPTQGSPNATPSRDRPHATRYPLLGRFALTETGGAAARNAGHTRERPPSLRQNETEMMNQDYCCSVQFPAPANHSLIRQRKFAVSAGAGNWLQVVESARRRAPKAAPRGQNRAKFSKIPC